MNSRRVVVTFEVETNLPLAKLRNPDFWGHARPNGTVFVTQQVQVNVMRGVTVAKKRKKKRGC